jgi:patatin-like phospholipase/acyl hydrolase
MSKFKILSIDGGGIKGIIPCTILKFIEDQIGPLTNSFDLMAGSSTGGIITMGLTTPTKTGDNAFLAQDMLDLYVKYGNRIFNEREGDWVSWISKLLEGTTIGKLLQKPYLSEGIETLLDEKFGDVMLKDALTPLLVTTYEIKRGMPFYFLSRKAQIDSHENFKLKDIARATSAAPTYFTPSVIDRKLNENLACIDGGVFANNPSILAYGEAKELWKGKTTKTFIPDAMPSNNDLPFFMLSIGTGNTPKTLSIDDVMKYRTQKWIEPLILNLLTQSVTASTHFTMQQLLPDYTDGTPRYRRLDLQVPEANSNMDDVSEGNINTLLRLGQEYIEENESMLLDICDLLSS